MNIKYEKIVDFLLGSNEDELNRLDFGIIGFDSKGILTAYNTMEETYSGLSREKVMGKPLFTDIAPCLNNYIVALKFEQNEELDEYTPYILSFKVKPTPVDLRLIKNKKLKYNYILVNRSK